MFSIKKHKFKFNDIIITKYFKLKIEKLSILIINRNLHLNGRMDRIIIIMKIIIFKNS